MNQYGFARTVFLPYVEPAYLITSGIIIIILNSVCLWLHVSKSRAISRYRMTFTMFLTQILYGSLLVGFNIVRPQPEVLDNEITPNLRYSILFLSNTILSRLIVSISSCLLAFDRMMVMALVVNYGNLKISFKLSILAATLNLCILVIFYGTVLLLKKSAGHVAVAILSTVNNLKHYVFTSITILEILFYVLFLLSLYRFRKKRPNSKSSRILHEVKQHF
ncbi:hypothetical protein L596_008770 [Steinernema carpocapsae]|uniref:G-protein coupled receptors family 1 profile domain-containing protein n=1 Tax=Steinernema carpocapsae TaxID=34508 RepID=A0A4U5PEL4_STECR|nr:hypothetical protein L596_008770 [Steinernema carpocapsae]